MYETGRVWWADCCQLMWGLWPVWGGVWSVMVESQVTSTQMGQAHPRPKTLSYFGVRGLLPEGSGTGHGEVGVLGHLLPAERSWAGWANRLGGIAKLTLTSSIKPHFMEPCTLSWCSQTSGYHCPPVRCPSWAETRR